MEILIVGAGIGGLTAAIALRRNSHHVTLLEQSRLNQETGAAIFLPPNVNGLLREYGFVPEDFGANWSLNWRIHSLDGDLRADARFSEDEFHSPWQMIHRQQLHAGLKKLALDPGALGPPAVIITSARVVAVDAQVGALTLQDGSAMSADLILGADGVHSQMRNSVQLKFGTNICPVSTGQNCFRFLIPKEDLLKDAATRSMFASQNTLMTWEAEDRKLVAYPCDDNTILNFVGIHPANLSQLPEGSWHGKGRKVDLLAVYKGFVPEITSILQHVNPQELLLYPLLDMPALPGWTVERLALLGDAAHPFLPHLGQGGAMAIEDAFSLGVFLPEETKPSQIPVRLQLYEKARKDRAHLVQHHTRLSGRDRSKQSQADHNAEQVRSIHFNHNELEHSRKILACHRAEIGEN